MIERVEKLLSEVRATLLNDDEIRKLLFHDSNNALNMAPPELPEVEKYIVLQPIFEMCNHQDYSQNTLINIEIDSGELYDVAVNAVLRINIVVNADRWPLINGRVRPLSLVNRVVELLDRKKFSPSNKLEAASFTQLIITKQMSGYAVLFDITDGTGEINNF